MLRSKSKVSSNNPLISVIIPVYNADNFLAPAINSIVNQSYKNLEILIADDCSTDNSKHIINTVKDNRIKRYYNKTNFGYLKTVNFLFKKAQGQFITFQDADDLSEVQRIERQWIEFDRNPELNLCGTFIEYLDERGNTIGTREYPQSYEEIRKFYKTNNPFCGATLMVKKEVLNVIGGYRPFFNRIGNEDYDWAALIIEKYNSKNIPEYLYKVRKSRKSISRSIKNPEQMLSSDYVKFFISERKYFGQDYIQGNQISSFPEFQQRLILPYKKDKSLIKRKDIDVKYYNGLKKELIISAIKAVAIQPLRIINYKYFIFSFYQFIKSIFEK